MQVMGVLGGAIAAISKPTSAWEVLLVGRYFTCTVLYCNQVLCKFSAVVL
jgi:hypothetical protein